MIVAVGRSNDDKDIFILLGITKENIKRLKEGKPIMCTNDTHQLPEGLAISIMYGKTEDDIKRQIEIAWPGSNEIDMRNKKE